MSVPISFTDAQLRDGNTIVFETTEAHFPHSVNKPPCGIIEVADVRPDTKYVIVHPVSLKMKHLFPATTVPMALRWLGFEYE